MSKAAAEFEVFLAFASAAGLNLEPGSVRSEAPPRPDITCRIGDQLKYFELTRAADQGIANEVGGLFVKARRTGEGGVGRPQVYDDKRTLTAAVQRKAAAKHETDGAPLDLVVYYDGVFHPVPRYDWVEETATDLRKLYRDRWNSIWLYDHTTGTLLG